MTLCFAKVISGCNSLFTMELVYPRFIHSEFMTHRVFSRNASSSRAIPIDRIIDDIKKHPVVPEEVYKNCKGMSGKERLSVEEYALFKGHWLSAMDSAIEAARELQSLNIHKQTVNRLLEPFMFIKTLVTSTEWGNFFTQRISPNAQPEMRELACAMKNAQESWRDNTSASLNGDCFEFNGMIFSLPYVTKDDIVSIQEYLNEHDMDVSTFWQTAMGVSAARCARVSYNKHDGTKPTLEEDMNLARRLYSDGHMSPFEHPCMFVGSWSGINNEQYFDNLRGWVSARNLLTNGTISVY